MTKKKLPPPNKKSGEKTTQFHYIKTNSYRTYHVDGMLGALTPRGDLYTEMFIERQTTPKLINCQITEQNELIEKSRDGLEGIVREIEAGLIMDYRTMVSFRNWLNDKIEEYEQVTKKEKTSTLPLAGRD